MVDLLHDISFNISNFCHSRCVNCSLWQERHWNLDDEIPLKALEKNLFSDPLLSSLTTLHLTGGAPHLSPRFLPILHMAKENLPKDVRVNSPLEGMFPNLVHRVFGRALEIFPRYRVDLALEGPTAEIHNKVRPRSWETTWATYDAIADLGLAFQWEMTIYPSNHEHILRTYNMIGRQMYLNFGRFSTRFGNETQGLYSWPTQEQIDHIDRQLHACGWIDKRDANRKKWMLQKAMWEGKRVRWDCGYGKKSIDIQPNGDIYPCLQYPQGMSMGNLKESTLTEIMESSLAKQVLKKIAARECQTGTGCPFTLALWADNVVIE